VSTASIAFGVDQGTVLAVSSPAAFGADQGTEAQEYIYSHHFIDKKFVHLDRILTTLVLVFAIFCIRQLM
jgi:hypothetical protein